MPSEAPLRADRDARAVAAVVLAVTLCGGCGDDDSSPPPASNVRPLVTGSAPAGFPAGPLSETGPSDNTLTEERARLGKRLFFERRLSRTNEIACGSCHAQEHGFADPRTVSLGVEGRSGKRNAPALSNLAWGVTFFWDGRAETLEEQAGMPIEDVLEMDLPLATAVGRLSDEAGYVEDFRLAYDSEPTEETLRKALASFVRTLASGNSAYDRHLAGVPAALEPAALRGEALFFGKAACFHCHPPGALTNDGFFNNGTFTDGADVGRQAVTGRTGDLGKFKVPGLRNVAVSAPYMHDGSLATLDDVVDHYDRGGLGHPSTDPQIETLGLSGDEKADLVAFMQALTDDEFLEDPRFRP
jgi:cytochrome c peroxidase